MVRRPGRMGKVNGRDFNVNATCPGVYLLVSGKTMAALSGLPDNNGGEDNRAFKNFSAREQLGRILRSSIFANAPSLRRFLSYIVEQTLEGNPARSTNTRWVLTSFGAGIHLIRRPTRLSGFRPGDLRSKLEKYYASEGQADPSLLTCPGVGTRPCFGTLLPPIATRRLAHEFYASTPTGRMVQQAGLPPPLPLPAACTSFVGREKEVADVKRAPSQ